LQLQRRFAAPHADWLISHEAELGEETLAAVAIEGDRMLFTSNDVAIHEVWERFLNN
jgi:hypothetical protein